ncbi:MAG: hypothetical protein NTY20_02480 [Candidatus Aenigmarchaeota archaeon]|nr:hypothetical protein [Candidatus Aenigmarchaeota archaeon]
MDRYFTLPSEETIDTLESEECLDFDWETERYPLFVRNHEEYFAKKLGQEWPSILKMEKEVISHHKKHGPFAPGCHKANFTGREGELYVFDVHSYYDAGDGDHGPWDGTYKVRLEGSEISILDEKEPLPEDILNINKIGSWLYGKAKEMFSSAFQ